MLQLDSDKTEKIAEMLKDGAVLAVPTETVWGFTAGLNSEASIQKLIEIKDRDVSSGKVFTLVPEDVSAISKYAELTPPATALIEQYFPGPLTMILPKNPVFRHPYYDHFDTIGLRIPNMALFHELLPKTGPLILTSANRRGKEPLFTAEQISDQFPELDGLIMGQAGNEPPSTVIDFTGKTPKILRQGRLKVV